MDVPVAVGVRLSDSGRFIGPNPWVPEQGRAPMARRPCPDHWRHVHNRLAAGEAPRRYSREQHWAWMLRKKIDA
jgi:hypothetical protein